MHCKNNTILHYLSPQIPILVLEKLRKDMYDVRSCRYMTDIVLPTSIDQSINQSIKLIPDDILALSKLKAVADDNFSVAQMVQFFSDRIDTSIFLFSYDVFKSLLSQTRPVTSK